MKDGRVTFYSQRRVNGLENYDNYIKTCCQPLFRVAQAMQLRVDFPYSQLQSAD